MQTLDTQRYPALIWLIDFLNSQEITMWYLNWYYLPKIVKEHLLWVHFSGWRT